MIDAAGGEAVLCAQGTPSARVGWPDIQAAMPEVVVFIPCGYGLDEACEEAQTLLEQPELRTVRAVFAADASSHFSRPGPRLVDGVEALAFALHPEISDDGTTGGLSQPAGAIRRLR